MIVSNKVDENLGVPIAKFMDGKKYNLVYLDKNDNSDSDDEKRIDLNPKSKFEPRLNPYQRTVTYISGPSGSGKTTYASNLIKAYLKFQEKPFFIFSRTDCNTDPAFKGLKYTQIAIDNSLIEDPIDITEHLTGGSLVLFDDCNTIQDKKLKLIVEKLMEDILEIGRKLDITIIITSHLVIPSGKNFSRTIMNELQTLTVFPKSGSAQQIRYALKTYFGLANKQIDDILAIKSRWVTISKSYPMYVLSERSAYIL